jgi:hypothetical protein
MPTVLQASATPNNQYLVWDRYAGNWIGTWEGDTLKAAHFFTWMDGETERAGVIGPDGMVYQLLVDGTTDDDGVHEGMVFEAEADMGDQESPAQQVEVTLEHHYGAWASFVQAEGVGETSAPAQVVPDATVYKTWASGAYDLTNAGDNQLAPHREDYATLVREGDEGDVPPGGFSVSAAKGWMFSARQSWAQKLRATKPLKSMLVRLESMRGWVGVRRIAARLRRKPFARGRVT